MPHLRMPSPEEDRAITAAAESDPDAQPLTDEQLQKMQLVLRRRPKAEDAKDRHRQELQAMFDSFLGVGYDPAKVSEVAALQTALRAIQTSLMHQLDAGALTSTAYADELNAAIRQVFAACEDVLGSEDFERLFGEPSVGDGFIDASKMSPDSRAQHL